MSSNQGTVLSRPNWNTFDEMKNYAKQLAREVTSVEPDNEGVYAECYIKFKECNVLNSCVKLAKKFVEYMKDSSKSNEVKTYISDLESKWESILQADIENENISSNANIESEENFNVSTTKDDDIKENTEVSSNVANIKANDKAEEQQLSLTGDNKDDEKELKKQITALKRKFKKINLEYDKSKTLEENQSIYDEQKKIFDENAKKQKEIENLKANMIKLSLEYNDTISFEDNKKLYETAKDKKDNPSHVYPFKFYFKGHDIRELDHIFEKGKSYTAKEICSLMFKHGYREFAGKVSLEYDKEENMIIPNFTSQLHG